MSSASRACPGRKRTFRQKGMAYTEDPKRKTQETITPRGERRLLKRNPARGGSFSFVKKKEYHHPKKIKKRKEGVAERKKRETIVFQDGAWRRRPSSLINEKHATTLNSKFFQQRILIISQKVFIKGKSTALPRRKTRFLPGGENVYGSSAGQVAHQEKKASGIL